MPIHQGDVFVKYISFRNRSNGQPVGNISTWQLAGTLRDASGAPLLTLTMGTHISVQDADNAQIRIQLTAPQTSGLPVGPVSAVIRRTDASPGPVRMFRIRTQVRESE